MSTKTNTTLDQKRAAFALKRIKDIQAKSGDGMYVSYVSSFPATVVMNGLGQALITQLAQDKGKKKSHYDLYMHVTEWLSKRISNLKYSKNDPTLFMTSLMNEKQETYLLAQAETMAFLNWLKQFARAYLKESEKTNDE